MLVVVCLHSHITLPCDSVDVLLMNKLVVNGEEEVVTSTMSLPPVSDIMLLHDIL